MKKLLHILSAFVISVVIIEALLRSLKLANTYNADSLNNPGLLLDGTENVAIREGYGVRRVNNIGVFDKPLSPDNEVDHRILLFGDGFTEALQVHDDEVYDNVAEELFAKNGNRVEIVNFGRSGLGTIDELDYYLHFADKLKHDKIVIQFSSNDIPGNYSSRFKLIDGNIVPNRWIEKNNSAKSRLVFQVRSSSAFANLLFVRYYEFCDYIKDRFKSFGKQTEKVSDGFDVKRIEYTKSILRSFKQGAEQHGAELYLFQIPDFTNSELDKVDVVRSMCNELGIKYLPILDEVNAKRSQKDTALLNGFMNTRMGEGHLNRKGHLQIGSLLFNSLRGELKQ